MENHAQRDDHLQRRSHRANSHEITITQEDESSGGDLSRKVRKMHRVLPQLMQQQHIDNLYDPILVSLGPYHHGRPELQPAQDLKPLCLDWFASGSEQNKAFYYNKINEKIDEIRDCYAEAWILEKYDDEELTRMMLLDGCFIINYMASRIQTSTNMNWDNHLGLAAGPITVRDLVKIENQVPFMVIKLLLSSQVGRDGEWDELVHGFLRWMLLKTGSKEQISVAGEYDDVEDPPLHVLEAIWRAITSKYEEEDKQKQTVAARISMGKRRKRQDKKLPQRDILFGSVMDLKAKGISFSPSSHSLRAITFESGLLHGHLKLPIRFVSDQHQVILSNLISYELSPESNSTYFTVLSYVAFMKALIESDEDVKELQESGILFDKYSNNEQVVASFKEIDTFGLAHWGIFDDVKEKIGEHCTSRPKTWIANLVRDYFRSPWRVISLSAATSLLVFSFLQTFYAIRGARHK